MSGPTRRTFHVVTQRRWMVDELTAALVPAGWSVVAHHGLSALPPGVGHCPEHILWCPSAFAAREIVHGNLLRLAAPGPTWLPAASIHFAVAGIPTGRLIALMSARSAYRSPRTGFWKLAEAKLDSFPAKWRGSLQLRADIKAAGLPDDALLQMGDTRLSITREYRAIVIGADVASISSYLDPDGRDRSDPDFAEPDPAYAASAQHAADDFAIKIARQHPAGQAYSLDLAWTTSGWAVIEANPVWCSAWYGCDIPAFAEAVAVAQGLDVQDRFVWRPDALLVSRSVAAGPLPHDGGAAGSPHMYPV